MFHRRTALVLTLSLGMAAPLAAQNKAHKIDEALTHALKAGCATVGGTWLATGVPFESILGGEMLQWPTLIIWGGHRAHGGGVIDEYRPAWATNVVWGTAFAERDNIVWGNLEDVDNIVWGRPLSWG